MRQLRIGRPVWLQAPAANRDHAYPALEGQIDADVAIVGGGMTGASVAKVFADAGVRVVLVEAALVGRGSTVASTALLLCEPDLGLTDLGRRYGAAKARRIWQLSARGARSRGNNPAQ